MDGIMIIYTGRVIALVNVQKILGLICIGNIVVKVMERT